MKFVESKLIQELSKISLLMFNNSWNERNAGNISYLIKEDELLEYDDMNGTRKIPMRHNIPESNGMIFLVTGTNKMLRNIHECPEENTGVVKVCNNGTMLEILWGFSLGGAPTSEFTTHIHSHITRLKHDKDHRAIIHCHPVKTIAMTFLHELDDKKFTLSLWKTITECILIFNDGVSVLPWMSAGGEDVALITASKFEDCRAVIWGQHGIFASENSLENAFGLIEVIEKGAEIFMLTYGFDKINDITTENLIELCKIHNITARKHYLN